MKETVCNRYDVVLNKLASPFMHFFSLVRLPNLGIIGFTQYFTALYLIHQEAIDYKLFILIISTVLIAAGGYIFNDIADLSIDQVNKPERVTIEKFISRKRALILYLLFTFTGTVAGLTLSYLLGAIQLFSVLLLFSYNKWLKRRALIGNISIGVLTGLSMLIVGVYYQQQSYLLVWYSFFAFFLTLIRELIKDLEDIEGDRLHGCKTLPIVLGAKQTKRFLFALISIYTGILFVMATRLHYPFGLFFLLLFLLKAYMLYRLFNARIRRDYTLLNKLCKLEMIIGIFSMPLWA